MAIFWLMHVSVHKLKNNLSKYLRLALKGEPVVITSHKKLLVKLVPLEKSKANLTSFLAAKKVHWNGGKPKGSNIRLKAPQGKTVAAKILEDRR